MPERRYLRLLHHYIDFLEYQDEAYEKAKRRSEGEEV
jgi:hypothetical protein